MARRQLLQSIITKYLLTAVPISAIIAPKLDPIFSELIRKYRKVKAWEAEAIAEKKFEGASKYRSHEVALATQIADHYL